MPRTEAGQRNILEKFSHFSPFFLSANGIYGIMRKIPRPAARAQNGGLHGEGSERTFHSDKRGRESGMGITEEALWKVLEQKAEEEDEHSASGQKIAHEYLAGIKAVCTFGVDRSKMIRDQFPMYTLHDEVHKQLTLRNTPSRTDECGQLLYQLQITYLKQNYGLCMTRDSFFGNICIRKKGKDPIEKTAHIFPPALFLHTNKKYKHLRRKSSYALFSCNAEHSLSQFMLKNGELLHQKVPGILKELIRILQEENDSNLVQKVNNLLACLRNLPGQPITVPDDVFLTEDDLF